LSKTGTGNHTTGAKSRKFIIELRLFLLHLQQNIDAVKAQNVKDYIKNFRRPEISNGYTRETILPNILKALPEEMSYGMIGYVVPHSIILTAIIAIKTSATFYQYCITEKFYRFISYGYL
jgi:hypothetical protein